MNMLRGNVSRHINILSLLLHHQYKCSVSLRFSVVSQSDEFTLPYSTSMLPKIGLCFEASESNFLQI